jgi:pSer/pThr/pTyr-binding forkhead associated (FHA) protein
MNAVLTLIIRLLLVLLSYIFIGWIAYLIFMDLKRMRSDKKFTSSIPIMLSIKTDDLDQERTFQKPVIIIGRDPAVDFILQDDRVSLRHCKIEFIQNQWWVEDLTSTNGTYLNGSLLSTRAVLMNNDQLSLGNIEINIQI